MPYLLISFFLSLYLVLLMLGKFIDRFLWRSLNA